jgi:hypothetical protein
VACLVVYEEVVVIQVSQWSSLDSRREAPIVMLGPVRANGIDAEALHYVFRTSSLESEISHCTKSHQYGWCLTQPSITHLVQLHLLAELCAQGHTAAFPAALRIPTPNRGTVNLRDNDARSRDVI